MIMRKVNNEKMKTKKVKNSAQCRLKKERAFIRCHPTRQPCKGTKPKRSGTFVLLPNAAETYFAVWSEVPQLMSGEVWHKLQTERNGKRKVCWRQK